MLVASLERVEFVAYPGKGVADFVVSEEEGLFSLVVYSDFVSGLQDSFSDRARMTPIIHAILGGMVYWLSVLSNRFTIKEGPQADLGGFIQVWVVQLLLDFLSNPVGDPDRVALADAASIVKPTQSTRLN